MTPQEKVKYHVLGLADKARKVALLKLPQRAQLEYIRRVQDLSGAYDTREIEKGVALEHVYHKYRR